MRTDYVTTISVKKSEAEIKAILEKHGVRGTVLDYDIAGQITSLEFQVETPNGLAHIRLPLEMVWHSRMEWGR
jgi:hypothetical protein